VVSQVLLPLGGPVTDAFLVYLLITGSAPVVAVTLGVAALLDVVLCGWAIRLDREDWSLLPYAPLLRIIWRPLQLLSVARSVGRWMHGHRDAWRRVNRYDSVPLMVAVATNASNTVR
jgi:hypothetical protein